MILKRKHCCKIIQCHVDIVIEVLGVWEWKPRLLGRFVGVVGVAVSVSSFVGVLLIVLRLLIGMNMYRQVAWWLLAQVWLLRRWRVEFFWSSSFLGFLTWLGRLWEGGTRRRRIELLLLKSYRALKRLQNFLTTLPFSPQSLRVGHRYGE